jgi:[protein-PII] uridylyltransferase
MTRELGGRSLAADWRSASDARHTVLTVCARDAPGLLARLAGTLTGHGLDILSVDAFTRSDGVILDTFKVCEAGGQPVRTERWPKIEADLVAAVEGRHDVDAAVVRARERMGRRPRRRPPAIPAVTFDAGASLRSTVVEVRADDEPGLVYKIARTLAQLGLNISLAKIATEKSQALDVFYVTDADGQVLPAEEHGRIEDGLLTALGHER